MNIEKDVVKKTNKYVYLSNGTHMSYSDFHHYKQGIRNNEALVHAKKYKDSVEMVVADMKQLEKMRNDIQDQMDELEWEMRMKRDNMMHDWEESYRGEAKKHDETRSKITSHARRLYADLSSLPILQGFQEEKGIKFIIQENEAGEYRFCFDPYQLGANYHSTLSDFYRKIGYGTVNGGWMKVIGNDVILYAESGDYGVYDDQVAIAAARVIFPNHEIKSYAGKSWGSWELPL